MVTFFQQVKLKNKFVNTLILICCVLVWCFPLAVFAQADLFFNDKPISVVLKAPFTKLLMQQQAGVDPDQIKNKSNRMPALLILKSDNGKPILETSVLVQLRGHSSLLLNQCDFPKLKIIFPNNELINPPQSPELLKNIFSGIEKLDLGTHCSVRGGFSPQLYRSWMGTAPHREALVYRMLDLLGVATLRSQMLYIDYVDSENGRNFGVHRQAFFLEDIDAAAKRLQGIEYFSAQKKYVDADKSARALFHFVQEASETDQTQVAVMLLFENLIRNNDWKLRIAQSQTVSTYLWNVKVVKVLSINAYYVLPYDFDLSEVVSGYPRSDENVGYYSSLVGADAFSKAIQIYKDKKKALYQLIPLLQDVYSQRLLKKNLDRFYNQLP